MKTFYDALRESIITQALITVGVVGVWLFLTAQGIKPDDTLTQVMMIIIGFYFGSKVGFRQGEAFMSQFVPKREHDDPHIKITTGKE
jgi:Mn2+/Fe2+ NRAMP family transporter